MSGIFSLFSDIFSGMSGQSNNWGGDPWSEGQYGNLENYSDDTQEAVMENKQNQDDQYNAMLGGMLSANKGHAGRPMEKGTSAYTQAPDARTLVTPMGGLLELALNSGKGQPEYQNFIKPKNDYLYSLFGDL